MAHPAAQRYADAFIASAAAGQLLPRLTAELNQLATLIERVPQTAQLLAHPEIPLEKKLDVIKTATQSKWLLLTYQALVLLIGKGRTALLGDITALLDIAVRQSQGIERVHVRTARPLTLDLIQRLQERLTVLRMTQIEMTCEVDPALFGGCQLLIGNHIIDGSLQTQLDALEDHLTQARL